MAPPASSKPSAAPVSEYRWLWQMLAGGVTVVVVLVGLPMLGSLVMEKDKPSTSAPVSSPSASVPSTAAQPSNPNSTRPPQNNSPAPERGLIALLPKTADAFQGDTTLSNAFLEARNNLTGGKSPMLVKNSMEGLLPQSVGKAGREHLLAAAAFASLRVRDAGAAENHLRNLTTEFPSSPYQDLASAMQVEVNLLRASPPSKDVPADQAALENVIQQANQTLGQVKSDDAKGLASQLIARALDAQGKQEQAIESYLSTATRYPQSAYAAQSLLTAGVMLQKKGNAAEARNALRRLVAEYPGESATKEGNKYLRELELIGAPAPELQVLSWEQGEATSMADLKGKVVLVNFWQTWCPHCRKELPHLSELYNQYKDQGLVVLGVTRDDKQQDLSGLQSFLKDNPVTFPIVRVQQQTARDYVVSGIPAAALVDRNGVVQWRAHPGSLTNAQIETLLAQK
ncbi:MAG: redoxin domain-containing protein [Myxococcota bacterium]